MPLTAAAAVQVTVHYRIGHIVLDEKPQRRRIRLRNHVTWKLEEAAIRRNEKGKVVPVPGNPSVRKLLRRSIAKIRKKITTVHHLRKYARGEEIEDHLLSDWYVFILYAL